MLQVVKLQPYELSRDFALISYTYNLPVNFQYYCPNKPHTFFHSLHSFLLPVTYPTRVSWHIGPLWRSSTFLGLLRFSSLPFVNLTLPHYVPFSTILLRVFLGVPLLVFPYGAQLIAMLQSLYCRMWPIVCPIQQLLSTDMIFPLHLKNLSVELVIEYVNRHLSSFSRLASLK